MVRPHTSIPINFWMNTRREENRRNSQKKRKKNKQNSFLDFQKHLINLVHSLEIGNIMDKAGLTELAIATIKVNDFMSRVKSSVYDIFVFI